MPKTEDLLLFELIHSMGRSEKKTFSLLAGYASSSPKKYVTLFDLIHRRKVYDEVWLKQQLIKAKIKTPLPVLKNYLLELVQRSLRFHHEQNSTDAFLRNMLHDVEILHRKGLDRYAQRQLKRVKSLSRKYERKEVLLDALNKEWMYRSVFNPKKVEDEHLHELNSLIATLESRKAVYEVSLLMEKGEIRDDLLKDEWETLFSNRLKSTPKNDYEIICNFHHNRMRYYHRMNDFENCCRHQEALVSHMESRPDLLTDYKVAYAFELNGLAVAYCQIKNFEPALGIVDKLDAILKNEKQTNILNSITDILCILYGNIIHGLYMDDAKKAVRYAHKAEHFLKEFTGQRHHAAFLYLNLAKTHIYTGQYKKAIQWTNAILHDSPENRRDDFYVLAWLFNLIIHYELENLDLLPSLIRSTFRFLKKRKRLYKTETLLMETLQHKLPKSNSRKEMLEFFRQLKSSLEELSKDPYEAKAFVYFDFIAWLESKIEGRTVVMNI